MAGYAKDHLDNEVQGTTRYWSKSGGPHPTARPTALKQVLAYPTDLAVLAPVALDGTYITGAALTETNDTNVTATLTGTPTTALLRAAGFTLGWTGTLADVRGGIDTGVWTAVTFAAGNFTAQAGNWTLASGDQLMFRYRLFGKTMHVGFVLVTTTVSATPTYLQITIPASKTAAATFGQPISAVDNGTARNAAAVISSTNIRLYIDAIAAIGGAGTWATATDNTAVFGTLTFETT